MPNKRLYIDNRKKRTYARRAVKDRRSLDLIFEKIFDHCVGPTYLQYFRVPRSNLGLCSWRQRGEQYIPNCLKLSIKTVDLNQNSVPYLVVV